MDEAYALDFDDIVGGMPTRFRYRQVPANDFGLTAEEVIELHENLDNAKLWMLS